MSDIAELYGYIEKPIDIDQGVTIRVTDDGMQVYMYKAMPGLYLRPDGTLAADTAARKAGFDVELHRREADALHKIQQVTADIRRKQVEAEAEIRSRTPEDIQARMNPFVRPPSVELDPDPELGVVITVRNAKGDPRATRDFAMKNVGAGKWDIIEPKSDEVLAEKLPTTEAVALMVESQRMLDLERATDGALDTDQPDE